MAAQTATDKMLRAQGQVEQLRVQLDEALNRRNDAMADMHEEGYSYEQIARMAGEITQVGVFRAIKRKRDRELEEATG